VGSESIEPEVIDLVAGVLGIPPTSLADAAALAELQQWDSLAQLNVLLALEEHFSIELSPDDLERLTDVDAIVQLVSRHQH
jgi:acyl carrier protein